MHDLMRGMATLGHHHADDSLQNTFTEASIVTRVIAELFATRFDKQLVAGVAPEPGSVLAAHVSRLASRVRATQARGRAAPQCLRGPLAPYADVGNNPRRPVSRRSRGGFDRSSRAAPDRSVPGERARCRAAAPAAVRRRGADVLARRSRPGRRTARCARPAVTTPIAPLLLDASRRGQRLLMPAVEQRGDFAEEEGVKVAHLGEAPPGQAVVPGGGDPRFGGCQHG